MAGRLKLRHIQCQVLLPQLFEFKNNNDNHVTKNKHQYKQQLPLF